jgi:hypothetical protein
VARLTAVAASVLLSVILAGCTRATSHVTPAPSDAETGRLSRTHVGTWRAVRFQAWQPDGTTRMTFGEHPSGYLVLDPTGHAFVHLMRTPPVRPFALPNAPTVDELRAAHAAYVSYYGPYTVDEAAGVLTIQAEGSNRPDFTGTAQVRRFQIRGDTLILGIPNQYEATLVRVTKPRR